MTFSLNSTFSCFFDQLQLLLHSLFGFILPPLFERMAALQTVYKTSRIFDGGDIFI